MSHREQKPLTTTTMEAPRPDEGGASTDGTASPVPVKHASPVIARPSALKAKRLHSRRERDEQYLASSGGDAHRRQRVAAPEPGRPRAAVPEPPRPRAEEFVRHRSAILADEEDESPPRHLRRPAPVQAFQRESRRDPLELIGRFRQRPQRPEPAYEPLVDDYSDEAPDDLHHHQHQHQQQHYYRPAPQPAKRARMEPLQPLRAPSSSLAPSAAPTALTAALSELLERQRSIEHSLGEVLLFLDGLAHRDRH